MSKARRVNVGLFYLLNYMSGNYSVRLLLNIFLIESDVDYAKQ